MAEVAEALAGAATALREAAREHKRAERQHRLQARALMARLSELRGVCELHGIELHIQGEGERSHGRNGNGTSA